MDSLVVFTDTLTDTVDGFPIWMYFACLFHQYALFPLFHWFASVRTFNILFTAYFLKDFFFDMGMAMTVHHIVGLVFIYKISNTKSETRAFTVAEFGSGAFNVNLLAKHYDVAWVSHAYTFYTVIMTASNLYAIHYTLKRKDVAISYRLVAGALIVGRQMYV